MRRRVSLVVVLLAAAVGGCGILLGTTDDPYVDPTLSVPPSVEAGEEAAPDAGHADAGNDVEIDAAPEDAGDEAAVDPDV